MDEVGGTKFAESSKAFGSRIDGKTDVIVLYDPKSIVSASVPFLAVGHTYSGTAGATILLIRPREPPPAQ